jgi:hypothetical protein
MSMFLCRICAVKSSKFRPVIICIPVYMTEIRTAYKICRHMCDILSRLRLSGAIPVLLYVSSWRALGQLYLYHDSIITTWRVVYEN